MPELMERVDKTALKKFNSSILYHKDIAKYYYRVEPLIKDSLKNLLIMNMLKSRLPSTSKEWTPLYNRL